MQCYRLLFRRAPPRCEHRRGVTLQLRNITARRSLRLSFTGVLLITSLIVPRASFLTVRLAQLRKLLPHRVDDTMLHTLELGSTGWPQAVVPSLASSSGASQSNRPTLLDARSIMGGPTGEVRKVALASPCELGGPPFAKPYIKFVLAFPRLQTRWVRAVLVSEWPFFRHLIK